jgi:DNA repair protein RadC
MTCTLREVRLTTNREADVTDLSILCPADVALAWRAIVEPAHWYDPCKECLVGFYQNVKGRIIGANLVAVGTLNSAPVTPSGVYRAAIVAGAHRLVVAHNHPSGDPTPSPEDLAITETLVGAGRLLEIELVDHLIIGGDGTSMVSIREYARNLFAPKL